jgi:hypothetical protein
MRFNRANRAFSINPHSARRQYIGALLVGPFHEGMNQALGTSGVGGFNHGIRQLIHFSLYG